ncbi:MAG: glycerol-3-phosphate dehydrogenase, partial [Cyanobacteria bacterium J06632_19]
MTNQKSVAILGAGAWGKALATLAQINAHDVRIFSRRGTASLAQTVEGADIILSAVSMKGVRDVVSQLKSLSISISPQTIFVTATKGLDRQTTCTPSQIWQDNFPDNPVVVLCGPNLSKEITQELPAATVAASNIESAAELVQLVFNSTRFRVYTNSDPLGVELGGTLKNVMAIASGV